MLVHRTFDELTEHSRDIFLAVGVFDGVHIGHQQLISQINQDALIKKGASVIVTFDPHPMRVLAPDKAPLLLTSTAHKLALIEDLGVSGVLLLDFNKKFFKISAEEFIKLLAKKENRVNKICVGSNFKFGYRRLGDVNTIRRLAVSMNYEVSEIGQVSVDGEIVSSTAIRHYIQKCKLNEAAALLGRKFSILGTVEHGRKVGSKLGYPTANLNPHNEVLPPNGVYVAKAKINSDWFNGLVNIGTRPTFKGARPNQTIELHILDFERDIFGSQVEVVFVQKLRDEIQFPSPADLIQQIAKDEQAARKLAIEAFSS